MLGRVKEQNGILSLLTGEQNARLNRYGVDVPLNVGTTILDAGSVIEHIYFVRSGLVSLVVVLPDNTIADAGFVNHEGAVGSVYDVNEPVSFTRDIVCAQGQALRVPREDYEEFKQQSLELRTAIDKCNNQIAARSQQTAACNLIHRLEQRLCRWLLQLAHDSVDSDVVVTQDHLARVLGVNRTSLNEALRVLYALEAISQTHRGVFRIRGIDRIGDHACGCYNAMRSKQATGARVM